MHYENLQTIQHRDSVEGASLLLGEISAIGPTALMLKSGLGTLHGVEMDSSASVKELGDAGLVPGRFAIVYQAGLGWNLFGTYPGYDEAAASLRDGLTKACAHQREIREHEAREAERLAEEQRLAAEADTAAAAEKERLAALAPKVDKAVEKPAKKPTATPVEKSIALEGKGDT